MISRRPIIAAVAAVAVLIAGGVALTSSSAVAGVSESDSQIRLGQVVSYNASAISVRLSGGDVQRFAYLRTYEPILGETVAVARQGSGWIVMGGLAAMPPDNPVLNPSFESDPDGTTPPSNWGIYQAGAFSPTVDVQGSTGLVYADGARAVEVRNTTSAFSGITYIYSAPIPVQPGQRWSASALFSSDVGSTGAAEPADVSVLLTWYANATDVYPTTAATDTVLGSDGTPLGEMSMWRTLRAGFEDTGSVVPANATHMRVALLTVTRGDSSFVRYDRVVAYRLS